MNVMRTIFLYATKKDGHVFFQLQIKGSTDSPDWFLRAHPPVRISPRGTPILILSAVDQRLTERLQRQGKLDERHTKEQFTRVFFGKDSAMVGMIRIFLETEEELRVLRFLLRLNSTKIQPTVWQKKNLPLEQSSPWLATFVRPLYLDDVSNEFNPFCHPPVDLTCCLKCRKSSDNLRPCGICKAVYYCSVDCRRAHWPKHKPSCFKAA